MPTLSKKTPLLSTPLGELVEESFHPETRRRLVLSIKRREAAHAQELEGLRTQLLAEQAEQARGADARLLRAEQIQERTLTQFAISKAQWAEQADERVAKVTEAMEAATLAWDLEKRDLKQDLAEAEAKNAEALSAQESLSTALANSVSAMKDEKAAALQALEARLAAAAAAKLREQLAEQRARLDNEHQRSMELLLESYRAANNKQHRQYQGEQLSKGGDAFDGGSSSSVGVNVSVKATAGVEERQEQEQEQEQEQKQKEAVKPVATQSKEAAIEAASFILPQEVPSFVTHFLAAPIRRQEDLQDDDSDEGEAGEEDSEAEKNSHQLLSNWVLAPPHPPQERKEDNNDGGEDGDEDIRRGDAASSEVMGTPRDPLLLLGASCAVFIGCLFAHL